MATPHHVWESRKRSRGYMQHQHQQGRDRISELPDEILVTVLQLLPDIKDVKTSLLSKRWKSVWTHTGVVRIRDLDYFPSNDNLRCINMYIKQKKANFARFTSRIFNQLQPLRKLSLSCYHIYTKQWLDIVTNKLYSHLDTLQELDLKLVDGSHLVKLPPGIFTCKKLAVLKINFNVEQLLSPEILYSLSAPSSPPTPMLVSLPCLKVLHLYTGHESYRAISIFSTARTHYLMDLSAVQNILRGCPVLEELRLWGFMHKCMSLSIKSPSLKRLNLNFQTCNSTIKIHAGNLEELDLVFGSGERNQIIIAKNSLSKATRITLNITTGDRVVSQGSRFIKMLKEASSTKYLCLSSHVVLNLGYNMNYQQLPVFNNLTDLKLDMCFHDSDSCNILYWFLEGCPNLLGLSMCSIRHFGRMDTGNLDGLGPRAPNCSITTGLRHLEKVELKDFVGSDHEMEFVRYLLEKAPVLKEMTLITLGVKIPTWLLRNVVKLPKASAACRVTQIKMYEPPILCDN